MFESIEALLRWYEWHAIIGLLIGAATVPVLGGVFYFIREIFDSGLADIWGWVYPVVATSVFQAVLFLRGRRWSLWQYFLEWRSRL